MADHARHRRTAYLVAVQGPSLPATVYAVMKRRPDDALEAVRALLPDRTEVAIVGTLSTRTARTIALGTDEIRPV